MKTLVLCSILVIGAYVAMPIIEGIVEYHRGERQ